MRSSALGPGIASSFTWISRCSNSKWRWCSRIVYRHAHACLPRTAMRSLVEQTYNSCRACAATDVGSAMVTCEVENSATQSACCIQRPYMCTRIHALICMMCNLARAMADTTRVCQRAGARGNVNIDPLLAMRGFEPGQARARLGMERASGL